MNSALLRDRIQRRTAAKKNRIDAQVSKLETSPATQPTPDNSSALRYHVLLQEVRRVGAMVTTLMQRLEKILPADDTSVQRTDTPAETETEPTEKEST
jgi:hypothetical protein